MPDLSDTVIGIANEISAEPSVTFLDDVQLSDGLLSGSLTQAALVACSDMGAWVPFVCSSPIAKLLLFQNFGHHYNTGGMLQAIPGSEIKNVIVYGHSDCKYTKHLAATASFDEQDQRRSFYAAALQSNTDDAWKTIAQYNILNEIKRMLVDPVLMPLIRDGELKIHGWLYNSASKQIEVFDPKQKVFVLVTK